MRPRSVFLITSHHLGWADVRSTLGSMPDLCIAGEAKTARAALRSAADLNPDVIITAASVEGASALPLVADLRACCPQSAIIVLAARLNAEEFVAFVQAGIAAYLLWNELDCTTLYHSVAAVMARGEVVVSSRAAAAAHVATQERRRRLEAPVSLKARERAVLASLAAGLSREQIAAAEHLSLRTVKRVIAGLEAKLEAPSPFVLGMKAALLGVTG